MPELLEHAAERFGPATAPTEPDGTPTSFVDLAADAARFGSALQDRGIAPGDRVAVMLPNTRAYVVALFGALRAGATVVQVNPIYVGRELEHVLALTEANDGDPGAAAVLPHLRADHGPAGRAAPRWTLLLVPRPTPDGLIELVRTRRPVHLAGVATPFVALQNPPTRTAPASTR